MSNNKVSEQLLRNSDTGKLSTLNFFTAVNTAISTGTASESDYIFSLLHNSFDCFKSSSSSVFAGSIFSISNLNVSSATGSILLTPQSYNAYENVFFNFANFNLYKNVASFLTSLYSDKYALSTNNVLLASNNHTVRLLTDTTSTRGFVQKSQFKDMGMDVGSMRRLRVTKGICLPSDYPIHVVCGSKDVIHS